MKNCKKDFNLDQDALWEHIKNNENCKELVQEQLMSIQSKKFVKDKTGEQK